MCRLALVIVLAAGLAACASNAEGPDQSGEWLAEAEARCERVWDGDTSQDVIRACSEIIASNAPPLMRAMAHNNRGAVFRRTARYEEAIADFDEAIWLEPGFSGAYSNRGITYSQMGNSDRAVQSFKLALRVMPGNSKAHNNFSWHLSLQGEYGPALEQANAALALEPDQEQNLDTQAHALMGLGRVREAEAAFRRAMEVGGEARVREYQDALAAKGYKPGRTDGVLDAETEAALTACIRDNCRLMLD